MTVSHDGKTFVTGTRKPSLPSLIINKGKNAGREYWLKSEETSIGRSSDCDIVVNDNNISRKHARIVYISGIFFIYDNESLNGTFLNGKKIVEAQLTSGDIIKMADTEFEFRYDRNTEISESYKGSTKTTQRIVDEEKAKTKVHTPVSSTSAGRLKMYGIMAAVIISLIVISYATRKPKAEKHGEVTEQIYGTSETSDTATALSRPSAEGTDTTVSQPVQQPEESDASRYYSQGLLAMMSKDYKRAISLFEKTLHLDPQYENAKDKLEKSLELLKKDIDDFYMAGMREYDILRYDRAILEWSKVLTLAKDFDDAMYKKAQERIAEANKKKEGQKQ